MAAKKRTLIAFPGGKKDTTTQPLTSELNEILKAIKAVYAVDPTMADGLRLMCIYRLEQFTPRMRQ